jgi:DNA replication protein DnaC
MRRVAFPDAELSHCTFQADDCENMKLSTVARRYVEHFGEMRKRGKGLLLYGEVDAGKTFAAACIANALIDQGKPCFMTNFARLVNTIGGMYDGKQEYIDGLNRFDLLVIDDFASERDTEYMGETVHNVIDARYRSRKPLIVTTNLTADELRNPQDVRKQRVYSRLLEMCLPVEVEAANRRKRKLVEDYGELRDMLGL